MKIIHNTAWFFPDSCGGTEVYVAGLASELKALDVENLIMAGIDEGKEKEYEYDGTQVYRYPVIQSEKPDQSRPERVHDGFEGFTKWLKKQWVPAAVYHQHSWATGANWHHLKLAKALGFKTFMTVHVPGIICMRGTMLLYGREACDGVIERRRCAACWAHSKGLPRPLARVLAEVPDAIGSAANAICLSRAATALAIPKLVKNHEAHFKSGVEACDQVIAVCQWLYDSLLLNGVPRDKLVLCRQGVIAPERGNAEVLCSKSTKGLFGDDEPLKLVFLGRFDKVKGLHLVIEAIKRLPPDVRVELNVYGAVSNERDKMYRSRIEKRIAGDQRIKIKDALMRNEIIPVLRKYDLMVVPSLWLETGPYVVLEAQEARLPVLGTRLGGIAELVKHGHDGWLVPYNRVDAWTQALCLFARDRGRLNSLKQNIQPVRNMAVVAREMKNIYERIIAA